MRRFASEIKPGTCSAAHGPREVAAVGLVAGDYLYLNASTT